MPVKRKTIALALAGNRLAATDAATGLGVTEACVQGEDGAVYLHAEIPAEWQDLTVRLQLVAANGARDESDPAVGGVIEMPIRAGVAVPGPLTVRLSGSDGAGVRKSADCRALTVRAAAVPAEPAPHLYPYAIRHITGSGGARVTRTENSAYNIDVSGTGGDMLEANYASGAGQANANKTDHALYAEAAALAASAQAAAAGGALETALRTGWIPLPACGYASATSFTLPGNFLQILSAGDKLSLTQSAAARYFYVTGAAYAGGATTVAVAGGSDFSLADAAISSPYFSKAASPAGFPDWFNWVPVWSAAGSMTYTPTTVTAKFRVIGKSVQIALAASGTTAGTASQNIQFSPPVPIGGTPVILPAFMEDGIIAPYTVAFAYAPFNGNIAAMRSDGGSFGIGSGRIIRTGGFYLL